jgi:CheY-like chemotaxis protein
VGTGSRPSADRSEAERLLHQLRSTLARLKAELELSEDLQALGGALNSLVEAIAIVDRLQARPPTLDALVVVLDDDPRLAELTARQLLRAGIQARAGTDPSVLRALNPATTQILVDLTLLRQCNELELSALSRFGLVVMSGDVSARARLEAESYSAAALLIKPFRVAEMLRSLDASPGPAHGDASSRTIALLRSRGGSASVKTPPRLRPPS